MKTLLVIALIHLFAGSSAQAASIRADVNPHGCDGGFLTTNLRVAIDGELFHIDMNCGFYFQKTFKTASGQTCTVKSGMCSNFLPMKKIEVRCLGDSAPNSASEPIYCDYR